MVGEATKLTWTANSTKPPKDSPCAFCWPGPKAAGADSNRKPICLSHFPRNSVYSLPPPGAGGRSRMLCLPGHGFRLRVPGLRLRVNGFRLRANGFGLGVNGFRLRVNGLRLKVKGFRLRAKGFHLRANGFGLRVSGFRARGTGFGLIVHGFRLRENGVRVGKAFGLPTMR